MAVEKIDFAKGNGLVPVIVQDYQTRDVLMVAYMNEEAWEKTKETGKAHYYSRSRKGPWFKGEESGHFQEVKDAFIDCDNDTILLQVNQIGGAACHEGYRSCFFRQRDGRRLESDRRASFRSQRGLQKVSELKLGIPKGSLEEMTIELFKRSGWKISTTSRSYFPSIDDDSIRCSLARPQEMSRYVEMGTLDVAITGKDWTLENASDVLVVCEMVYSKTSFRPTRWVVAVPQDSPIKKIDDLKGKRISSEMVNFTKRYFAERNIPVTVEFSWGATEAKAAEGLVDAIVEVTETGSTIRAHGLKIIHELMESCPQLIANKQAWQDPWKKDEDRADQTIAAGSAFRREQSRHQAQRLGN